MRAFVVFRLPDQSTIDLEHGALIGRVNTAALVLDDPRISEGHALLSLRGGAFSLLSLRRMFAVGGRPVSELRLEPGQRITFADGLELDVEAVQLPRAVLALEGPGLPRAVLPAVCALHLGPPIRLLAAHDLSADAWIWFNGGAWRLRTRGPDGQHQDRALAPGDRFVLAGRTFAAVLQPVQEWGLDATQREGGVSAPLHIISRFDTVTLHRDGAPPLVLVGQLARILSELIGMGGLAEWSTLAREIWPEEADLSLLRRRWDVGLSRLRQKLKDAGVRGDLLQSDGLGRVELVRYPVDQIDDEG